MKSKISNKNLITSALYAVIGVLLIILQGGSLNILMTVIGALLIVAGIVDVANNDKVKGIIELAIGVAIIVCGWLIADIVLLVFGILLIIKGFVEIVKTKRKKFMTLIVPIITMIIGVILIVAKWALLDVLCIVAGAIFIVNAVLTLVGKQSNRKKSN